MQALDPSGTYTDAEVIDALTGRYGNRTVDYRYDRLDSANTYLEPLTGVVMGGNVVNNSLADIKRTAKFSILDRTGINFLKDRVKPWARLAMPDGGWVEWPLGVFLLTSPSRDLDLVGTVARNVEAYDQLIVLTDDKIDTRYSIAAGTTYIAAITAVIATVPGVTATITPDTSARVLAVALEWEPGTSKLRILNDLLGGINYGSATFNESGTLVCRPYQSPSVRPVEYLYDDTQAQVRTDTATQAIDLFGVPNKLTYIKSEPDQAPLSVTVTNTAPGSPTSTVSRGRTIAETVNVQDAADLATLTALANRGLFEASQVYESVDFATIAMPMHSNADVLGLNIPALGLTGKYGETSWSLDLMPGAQMQHSVRRVVSV